MASRASWRSSRAGVTRLRPGNVQAGRVSMPSFPSSLVQVLMRRTAVSAAGTFESTAWARRMTPWSASATKRTAMARSDAATPTESRPEVAKRWWSLSCRASSSRAHSHCAILESYAASAGPCHTNTYNKSLKQSHFASFSIISLTSSRALHLAHPRRLSLLSLSLLCLILHSPRGRHGRAVRHKRGHIDASPASSRRSMVRRRRVLHEQVRREAVRRQHSRRRRAVPRRRRGEGEIALRRGAVRPGRRNLYRAAELRACVDAWRRRSVRNGRNGWIAVRLASVGVEQS